jgi:hypothetical protein
MKTPIKVTAWITALLFFLATLWSVTARGLFETARLDVPHFDAGAGNQFLLFRAGLAGITTLLLCARIFFPQPRRSRLFVTVTALLIIPVFLWSCLGLERWAAGYNEASFVALSESHSNGQPLTAQQVLGKLGKPIFTGTRSDGETVWSYSYMPSSGYGWHKRIFWLRGDEVTRVYSMNEP